MRYCEKSNDRAKCIGLISSKRNDKNLCDTYLGKKLGSKWQWCQSLPDYKWTISCQTMKNEINSCFYYSHTTVNQIVNLCFNIFPKGERKDIVNCITRQATELYEASLCDAVDSVCYNKKFLDESERDACYQEVAKAIFDKEICNSISSEKKRKDCIKIIEISIIY